MAKVSFQSLAPAIQSAFDTYWNRRYRAEELAEREKGREADLNALMAQLEAAAGEGRLTREHEERLERLRLARMTKQEDKARYEDQQMLLRNAMPTIKEQVRNTINEAQQYWDAGYTDFKNSPYGRWVADEDQYNIVTTISIEELQSQDSDNIMIFLYIYKYWGSKDFTFILGHDFVLIKDSAYFILTC